MILSGAMSSARVARLVTLGLTLGLASGALAGSPDQERALAKQHFEAGSLRFDLAEYEQALIEFKEAYSSPTLCCFTTSPSATGCWATSTRR